MKISNGQLICDAKDPIEELDKLAQKIRSHPNGEVVPASVRNFSKKLFRSFLELGFNEDIDEELGDGDNKEALKIITQSKNRLKRLKRK